MTERSMSAFVLGLKHVFAGSVSALPVVTYYNTAYTTRKYWAAQYGRVIRGINAVRRLLYHAGLSSHVLEGGKWYADGGAQYESRDRR